MQHSAASDLGMHCLPMSHKKEAMLIWVKVVIIFLAFSLNMCFGCSKEQSH